MLVVARTTVVSSDVQMNCQLLCSHHQANLGQLLPCHREKGVDRKHLPASPTTKPRTKEIPLYLDFSRISSTSLVASTSVEFLFVFFVKFKQKEILLKTWMMSIFNCEITHSMKSVMAWRDNYSQFVTLIDADIIAYGAAKNMMLLQSFTSLRWKTRFALPAPKHN